MQTEYKQAAQIFKAFADENRIHILKLLCSGEKCACKLLEELQISQPTLSHHMKILCDAGVVEGRREGKWMYYAICCDGVSNVRHMLKQLLSPENMPENCKCDENFKR